MTNRPKKRPVGPDQAFVRGPFRAARYGKDIVFESKWTEDAFAEMQKRVVAE